MKPSRESRCRSLRRAFLLLALAGGGAMAQQTVPERFPPGSIASDAAAEDALKAVEAARKEVEARYAADERACFGHFFANDCVQKAKETRRDAMSLLRPVEIEANTWRRRARADGHERAIAERSARREAEAAERLRMDSRVSEDDPGPLKVPREIADADREQAARAASVRAYEDKERQSRERQGEVAARKAARRTDAARQRVECTADCTSGK